MAFSIRLHYITFSQNLESENKIKENCIQWEIHAHLLAQMGSIQFLPNFPLYSPNGCKKKSMNWIK